MKQYYEENRQDKKMVRLAKEYNTTINPATIAARSIAHQFGLNRATAAKIRSLLVGCPNLAGEMPKNISLILTEMTNQGYSIEEAKEFIGRYSDILAQSNLGLKTKIERLQSAGLDGYVFASAQNLLHKKVAINEKALAVISEALKAHGASDDEVKNYFASHTTMLGQNSIDLRRVFAVLHCNNLLRDALFSKTSNILSLKADPAFINGLIESAKENNMDPNIDNLTEYYKSLDTKQQAYLREAYPFGLREKMIAEVVYNNYVGETKAPALTRTRES